MAKDDFLVTPMEYTSNGIKSPGKYGGDPAFPQRSDFGTGVPEKTFEAIPPVSGKFPAEGSPVVPTKIVEE